MRRLSSLTKTTRKINVEQETETGEPIELDRFPETPLSLVDVLGKIVDVNTLPNQLKHSSFSKSSSSTGASIVISEESTNDAISQFFSRPLQENLFKRCLYFKSLSSMCILCGKSQTIKKDVCITCSKCERFFHWSCVGEIAQKVIDGKNVCLLCFFDDNTPSRAHSGILSDWNNRANKNVRKHHPMYHSENLARNFLYGKRVFMQRFVPDRLDLAKEKLTPSRIAPIECFVLSCGLPSPFYDVHSLIRQRLLCTCYLFVLVPATNVDFETDIVKNYPIYFTTNRWYYAILSPDGRSFIEIPEEPYLKHLCPVYLRRTDIRNSNAEIFKSVIAKNGSTKRIALPILLPEVFRQKIILNQGSKASEQPTVKAGRLSKKLSQFTKLLLLETTQSVTLDNNSLTTAATTTTTTLPLHQTIMSTSTAAIAKSQTVDAMSKKAETVKEKPSASVIYEEEEEQEDQEQSDEKDISAKTTPEVVQKESQAPSATKRPNLAAEAVKKLILNDSGEEEETKSKTVANATPAANKPGKMALKVIIEDDEETEVKVKVDQKKPSITPKPSATTDKGSAAKKSQNGKEPAKTIAKSNTKIFVEEDVVVDNDDDIKDEGDGIDEKKIDAISLDGESDEEEEEKPNPYEDDEDLEGFVTKDTDPIEKEMEDEQEDVPSSKSEVDKKRKTCQKGNKVAEAIAKRGKKASLDDLDLDMDAAEKQGRENSKKGAPSSSKSRKGGAASKEKSKSSESAKGGKKRKSDSDESGTGSSSKKRKTTDGTAAAVAKEPSERKRPMSDTLKREAMHEALVNYCNKAVEKISNQGVKDVPDPFLALASLSPEQRIATIGQLLATLILSCPTPMLKELHKIKNPLNTITADEDSDTLGQAFASDEIKQAKRVFYTYLVPYTNGKYAHVSFLKKAAKKQQPDDDDL